MTESETSALVAWLFKLYEGAGATVDRADIYIELLGDLDAETASRAVRDLAKTSKWLPTVAEIREAAVRVEIGPARAGAEAWGDVQREIRRVGAYGAPRFEDPATAAAVRSLGWESLCIGDSSAMSDRARFCEIYDAVASRTREAAQRGERTGLERQLPGRILELVGKVGQR